MSVNRNILDSLRDVHEGMLSSISSNKSIPKENKVWLDAISKRSLRGVPNYSVDCFRLFNKSKLDSLKKKGLVKTSVKAINTSFIDDVYCKLYAVGGRNYIVYLFSSKGSSEFLRAIVHEGDIDTLNGLYDAFTNGDVPSKAIDVDNIKGCTCVANTFYNTSKLCLYSDYMDFATDCFESLICMIFDMNNTDTVNGVKRILTLSTPSIFIDDMEYAYELNFVTKDTASRKEMYSILEDIVKSFLVELVNTSTYVGVRYLL